MKQSTKAKEKPSKRAKTRLVSISPRSVQKSEGDELKQIWQLEIQALLTQPFSSLEQATDAVIESIVKRLCLKGQERKETVEYLKLLFESDEAAQSELKRALRL